MKLISPGTDFGRGCNRNFSRHLFGAFWNFKKVGFQADSLHHHPLNTEDDIEFNEFDENSTPYLPILKEPPHQNDLKEHFFNVLIYYDQNENNNMDSWIFHLLKNSGEYDKFPSFKSELEELLNEHINTLKPIRRMKSILNKFNESSSNYPALLLSNTIRVKISTSLQTEILTFTKKSENVLADTDYTHTPTFVKYFDKVYAMKVTEGVDKDKINVKGAVKKVFKDQTKRLVYADVYDDTENETTFQSIVKKYLGFTKFGKKHKEDKKNRIWDIVYKLIELENDNLLEKNVFRITNAFALRMYNLCKEFNVTDYFKNWLKFMTAYTEIDTIMHEIEQYGYERRHENMIKRLLYQLDKKRKSKVSLLELKQQDVYKKYEIIVQKAAVVTQRLKTYQRMNTKLFNALAYAEPNNEYNEEVRKSIVQIFHLASHAVLELNNLHKNMALFQEFFLLNKVAIVHEENIRCLIDETLLNTKYLYGVLKKEPGQVLPDSEIFPVIYKSNYQLKDFIYKTRLNKKNRRNAQLGLYTGRYIDDPLWQSQTRYADVHDDPWTSFNPFSEGDLFMGVLCGKPMGSMLLLLLVQTMEELFGGKADEEITENTM